MCRLKPCAFDVMSTIKGDGIVYSPVKQTKLDDQGEEKNSYPCPNEFSICFVCGKTVYWQLKLKNAIISLIPRVLLCLSIILLNMNTYSFL